MSCLFMVDFLLSPHSEGVFLLCLCLQTNVIFANWVGDICKVINDDIWCVSEDKESSANIPPSWYRAMGKEVRAVQKLADHRWDMDDTVELAGPASAAVFELVRHGACD